MEAPGTPIPDLLSLANALQEPLSPLILDEAEVVKDNLQAFCKLRSDPPLMQRARYLADSAAPFLGCFREKSCRAETEAARELLQYIQNRVVLENLPPDAVEELLTLAKKIAGGRRNEERQELGRAMAAELKAFKKSSRPPFMECPEKYLTGYNPPSEKLYVIPGMETLIAHWRAVYFGGEGAVIFAARNSKAGLSMIDLFPSDPFDRRGLELARITFRGNVSGELTQRNNAVSENGERFLYSRGKYAEIYYGAVAYSEWQPHLENCFVQQGLPADLAKIAIVESRMDFNAIARQSGATGPYQFLPETAKAYGLTVTDEVDERRNPVFAAQAAAALLRQAKTAILSEGFVPGVRFSTETADILSTSAYHAGIGNLRRGLREAGKELENAEEIITDLFTGNLRVGGFRDDSKDYPPQLYPAVEAVAQLPPDQRLRPLKLVAVHLDLKKGVMVPLMEMTRMLSYRDFIHINPQYDWDGSLTKKPMASIGLKARFLMLEADVSRLKAWLVRNDYAAEEEIKITSL